MKNILIISQFFAPQNVIAAIRFTKVVKYLARTGNYHFYVLCSDRGENAVKDEILLRDIESVREYITIMPVNFGEKNKKKEEKNSCNIDSDARKNSLLINKKSIYKKVKNGLLGHHQNVVLNIICKFIGSSLLLPYEIHDILIELAFSNKGSKLLQNIGNKQIDVIISTYGHIGAHVLGLKCKEKYPQSGWIVDYRDPIRGNTWLTRFFVNFISRKADKLSNYVTGAAESYCGSGSSPDKFHVIYNSFDKEDIGGLKRTIYNSKLTICYAGRIYSERQSMKPLFKMIDELIKEEKINKDFIQILYLGNQFAELEEEATIYNLETIIENGGFVSREKALQIQMNSDILCVMTWNQKCDGDIMPGKFFEYFMMDKPILALVAGDKDNSTVKRIIQDSEAGCCYEEANWEADYEVTKCWLLDKYVEFINNDRIINKLNKEYAEQYSSQAMAQKYEELIIKCGLTDNIKR